MRLSRRHGNGFTVIELLVVIGIGGLLIGMVLVAVQSAREASRRLFCQNNMRQIAIAFANYESRSRLFPPPSGVVPNFHHSSWVYLLPDLESNASYSSVSKERSLIVGVPPFSVVDLRPSILMCPSNIGAGCSYRVNVGKSLECRDNPLENPLESGLGAFVFGRGLTAAEFSDGLSNTVLFSERLQGNGRVGRGTIYFFGPPTPNTREAQEFLRGSPEYVSMNNWAGGQWIAGGLLHTWYNHVLPPNPKRDGFFTLDFTPSYLSLTPGVVASSSFHSGGVNVTFADSRVGLIGNAIDSELWLKLGTRKGDGGVAPE